jgi:hypothetical protein
MVWFIFSKKGVLVQVNFGNCFDLFEEFLGGGECKKGDEGMEGIWG